MNNKNFSWRIDYMLKSSFKKIKAKRGKQIKIFTYENFELYNVFLEIFLQ